MPTDSGESRKASQRQRIEKANVTSAVPTESVDVAEQKRLNDAREAAFPGESGSLPCERQWDTVREDYSADGNAWDYFTQDQSRSRAYRWGEDGLGGISDDGQRLCFALALWSERDPILKERLFGLTKNSEGNRGEDVKEPVDLGNSIRQPEYEFLRGQR
ncbi:MAG TPA: hypothetical protein VGI36_14825 [Candidatus Binataceae bacterium]|jgi:hypothetical protein